MLSLIVLVAELMCAVDIQKPDGTQYIGSYVYTEVQANALVETERAKYPSYIFTQRCK